MSTPQPPKELSGRCSAIHDDVLYVLSPDSFQSLPLKENATWSELPKGQSLSGPACVRAAPNGNASEAALYVIGGETDDDSYSGLSRFLFEQQKWEELDTPADVMEGRTNHGAAYLRDTRSILVYAGSQASAPSDISSQTFVIHTEDPHNIDSFTARAGSDTFVPALKEPILESWNGSHAMLVGGDETNKDVFLFDHSHGWQQYGTSLAESLPSGTRGAIVTGSDGSKVLETYDMSVSPNKVSQVVLQDASGQPAEVGQTIGGSSRKRKRDLTLQDWPEYNNTNAPTATRTEYSLAADDNGTTVIAGGNEDSPLAMFDQTGNEWIDADQFFDRKQQQPLQPSSTASPSPTSSPTESVSASASSTAVAGGGGGGNRDRTLRTLGITLGVLCGIAAIFIAALLYMRWRKLSRKKQQDLVEEKGQGRDANRMSFVDRGASFMKEAGPSVNDLLAPPRKDRHNKAGAHTSLAIIAGKIGANKSNSNNHAPKASFESTTNLVKDRDGDMEMMDIDSKSKTPIVKTVPVPDSDGPPPNYGASVQRREFDDGSNDRSSGWSKYFAASQPTGVSHLPSAYVKPHMSTDGSEYTSGARSQPSRIPSSVLVPPLDIDFAKTADGHRLSHVTTGSPSFAHSREDLARRGSTAEMSLGQSGRIENTADRPGSQTTVRSSYTRSELSSHFSGDYNHNSVNTPWTPFSNTTKDNQSEIRPTSSVYTNSLHESRMPSRGKSAGFFPGSGVSARPPPAKARMGHSAAPSADWSAPPKIGQAAQERDSTITVFPSGDDAPNSGNRPRELGEHNPKPSPQSVSRPSDSRDSTATVFPSGLENLDQATAGAPKEQKLPEFAPRQASALMFPENRDSTATVFPSGLEGSEQVAPPKKLHAFAPSQSSALRPSESRDSTATVFPSGVEHADQAAPSRSQRLPEFAPRQPSALVPSDNRDSTATVFPSGVEHAEQAAPPASQNLPEFAPRQPSGQISSDNRDSTATVFPSGIEQPEASAAPARGPRLPEFAPVPSSSLLPLQSRDSTATIFPRGVPSAYYANRPQEPVRHGPTAPAQSLPPPGAPAPADNRDSTATLFPKGVPSAYYANRPKELDKHDQDKPPMGEDISWLNLGLGGNRI
ncbi:hypothetical protein MBLNU230_g4448t1 [Neophaeotheca triangularis]